MAKKTALQSPATATQAGFTTLESVVVVTSIIILLALIFVIKSL